MIPKSFFIVTTLTLAAACAAPGDELEDVAAEAQEVQHEYFYDAHFAIVQDQSLAARATASLEMWLRNPDGSPQGVFAWLNGRLVFYAVRGTCGATFVSPHYAITAAHCVDGAHLDPAIHTVTMKNYDVSGATVSGLLASGILTGVFPTYQPTYGTPVTQVPGYSSTAYECNVVSRCSANWGVHNCPLPAIQGTDPDIALLHCPSRPAGAAWIPIASRDAQTGPVDMYWFHELLDMPVTPPPPGAPAELEDRYNHYTKYTATRADNFHYLWSEVGGLLPLKSLPWPSGAPRQRLGGNANGTTKTDLFACHGTSGSGVLQRTNKGGFELLGPMVHGSSTWVGKTLCTDGDTQRPGVANAHYLNNSVTRQFADAFSTILRNDRR
jgi:hypothetical protein